jgi:hypothetical protein
MANHGIRREPAHLDACPSVQKYILHYFGIPQFVFRLRIVIRTMEHSGDIFIGMKLRNFP